MSGELYEINFCHEITADLIQKMIRSLTQVMSKHGLKRIQNRMLWVGDAEIDNDNVKITISFSVQDARIRLLFPDRTVPRGKCESAAKIIGSEIFKELSSNRIKTQHVIQRRTNVISIPCG